MSRRDHQQKGDSKITLPITPMLDMSFQLLFFFMLNFNPQPAEAFVEMALPSEAQKAAHKEKDRDESKGHEKELKFDADLTVKVKARVDSRAQYAGLISAISVASVEKREDEAITVTGDPDPEALQKELLDKLRKHLAARRPKGDAPKKEKKEKKDKKDENDDAGPHNSLKLQGEGSLYVKNIIAVMDACRDAGYKNISFVQPDELAK